MRQSYLEQLPSEGASLALFLLINAVSINAVLYYVQPAGHLDLWSGIGATVLLAAFIPLFAFADFSFGYVVGVAFYSMIAGFIWITYVSPLEYDHARARWSAVASLLLFLLPLLFQTSRMRPVIALSSLAMNRLLELTLALAVVILAWNAYYGFALVGFLDAEQLRDSFDRPTILKYLTGSLTGGVLPFAFAYFACQPRYTMAAISLFLNACFYPVVLNKTVLLAVVWLPFLFLVFQAFKPKRAVVFALLVPMAISLIIFVIVPGGNPVSRLAAYLFGFTNYRMFAIPAMAMDRYSDFFASHELTHFCQISIIRAIKGCTYPYQLGTVMAEHYHLGNLNASLFATEGIASVGLIWAPLSALVCGLILSVGNSISARLSPCLIAVSSGLVVQSLVNTPLSTTFLSSGLLVLLLLWSLTPEPAVDARARPSNSSG
jgi:hypothetical protein